MNATLNLTMTGNGYDERAVSGFEQTLMTVTVVTGYIYVLLTMVGIALNAYVLFWLTVLACKDKERFINGCGMPLAAMSLADMLSLISIVVTVLFAAFFPPHFVTDAMRTTQCKIALFLIHTMTGVSTWCWLFVSALRYMAVYHPLWHISRWRLGQRSISAIFLGSVAINSWLLVAVVGFPNTCAETPLSVGGFVVNRWMHAIDLCWSYVIPGLITGTLDMRVLLTQPPGLARSLRNTSLSAASQTNGSVNNSRLRRVKTNTTMNGEFDERIEQEQMATNERPSVCSKKCSPIPQGTRARTAVWHWLAITTIDLLLNTPDNALRLISVIGAPSAVQPELAPYYHLAAVIARLFYFAQFCFNAAYLSTVVYKRNVQPRRVTAPPASVANRTSSAILQPIEAENVLQSIIHLSQNPPAGMTSSYAMRIAAFARGKDNSATDRHHSLDQSRVGTTHRRSKRGRSNSRNSQNSNCLSNGKMVAYKKASAQSVPVETELHVLADRTSSL